MDMGKGIEGPALLVQHGMKLNPHDGGPFVFCGRAGLLIKIIWYDGIAMSLYAKRLEQGRFVWPSQLRKGRCCSHTRSWRLCSRGSIGEGSQYVASAERTNAQTARTG
jgi:transposase